MYMYMYNVHVLTAFRALDKSGKVIKVGPNELMVCPGKAEGVSITTTVSTRY